MQIELKSVTVPLNFFLDQWEGLFFYYFCRRKFFFYIFCRAQVIYGTGARKVKVNLKGKIIDTKSRTESSVRSLRVLIHLNVTDFNSH